MSSDELLTVSMQAGHCGRKLIHPQENMETQSHNMNLSVVHLLSVRFVLMFGATINDSHDPKKLQKDRQGSVYFFKLIF